LVTPIRSLLDRKAKEVAKALDRALGGQHLRLPHYDSLVLIATLPGRSQRDLVEKLMVDPSTMVSILDHLESLDYTERRQRGDDRRKHAIHLTERGGEALARAGRSVAEVEGHIFGSLEPSDREALCRLLSKLPT
jgi:DNA-binding MarR family transcriptional regulator